MLDLFGPGCIVMYLVTVKQAPSVGRAGLWAPRDDILAWEKEENEGEGVVERDKGRVFREHSRQKEQRVRRP